MSERKKIKSIVSIGLSNSDYRLNRKCLLLLIFSFLFSYHLQQWLMKGSLPFYLSSVIFDNVQKAETRVGAQDKSIRFVETVHCCFKSGPGADTLFSLFLWVSSNVAK